MVLIRATAGTYGQYQVSFYGQLFLGMFYATGLFEIPWAGLILGFFVPVFWIILTYRLILIKARDPRLIIPFPSWITHNPGNTLIILADILFLGMIWFLILSGIYDRTWLRIVFAVIFPILSLSMLRNMVIFPFRQKEENEPTTQQSEHPDEPRE